VIPIAQASSSANAGSGLDESLFGAMKWRQVGPFRGGRVLAVTGVPGDPNVFYFALLRAVSGKPPTPV